jgi:oligoendopeptidase F
METKNIVIPGKPVRQFLPQKLVIETWSGIESYFKDLMERKISSVRDLEQWLKDRSELEAVISEEMGWRYIKMTCDTADQALTDSFNYFVSEIEPHIAPYNNDLNKKLIENEFVSQLNKPEYDIYLRGVKKALEIYREENIPLNTKISTDSQKYGAIAAAMTVNWKGQEITLQKAANVLKETDRKVREEVFFKMQERKSKDTVTLNDLFTELLKLRHQVAVNAGFKNYRDYKFAELGRFDYTVQDCFDFHQSISKEILPISESINIKRREKLKLDVLKPWDMDVDVDGKPALMPVKTGTDLIDKSIACFYKIRNSFGE